MNNKQNPTPKKEKSKPKKKESKKKLRLGSKSESSKKSMFLGYLNVGSNFNHLSSILSQ